MKKYKVIITMVLKAIETGKINAFEEKLKAYNEKQKHPVIHITTFEAMANAISEVLDDRDYDMQDVLADYLNYCYIDGLILDTEELAQHLINGDWLDSQKLQSM